MRSRPDATPQDTDLAWRAVVLAWRDRGVVDAGSSIRSSDKNTSSVETTLTELPAISILIPALGCLNECAIILTTAAGRAATGIMCTFSTPSPATRL